MKPTFIQFLIEAKTNQKYTLKTFDLNGTYVLYSPEDEETGANGTPQKKGRGSWKGVRLLQSGRGWHGEKIFALLKPEPVVVEVVGNMNHPKYVDVTIISGGNQPVAEWAKRPYVSKKSGVTNPHMHLGGWHDDQEGNMLTSTYGVFNNEMTVRKRDLK